MAKKKTTDKVAGTPVDAVRHKDKRKNIPTEELRDFVADEEQNPQAVLYPRNPDLDPQLVWKGKDQQDSQPLEVPAVPIYIQEKIHPQAIIEDFRQSVAEEADSPDTQLNLFADFNGLPEEFDQRVDFYHHDGNWSNRLILGNSLLVMTSLAEKENLKGRVQMIYMDPPYGIKFGSNWQVSTRKRDVKDGKAEDCCRQPEQVQAFRDTWKLGIHSYLPYLRDRLVVARELLTESGSLFVQIGDENVHLVRCLMDEVFGPENCISLIQFAKTSSASSELLPGVADYILWYAKNKETVKYRPIYREKVPGEEGASKYDGIELKDGTRRTITSKERDSASVQPPGSRVYTVDQLTSQRPPGSDPFDFHGKTYVPVTGYWKTGLGGLHRLAKANRVVAAGNRTRYVRYLNDFSVFGLSNIWSDVGSVQSRTDPKVYVVQTATNVLQRCLLMTTDPGDLVIDPTCGSGTTAYVAEQWGRRWITIDTSRVALTLARTRLMAGRFPFYLLADTPEGRKKSMECGGLPPLSNTAESASVEVPRVLKSGGKPPHSIDIRKGLVYKRVPHVTLKAIANNEEIDTIHAQWQEKLEPIRDKLNKLLNKKWEEWEIPPLECGGLPPLSNTAVSASDEVPRVLKSGGKPPHSKDWPADVKKLLKQWWEFRQARQQEIDASIARRAETEMLYDQPYEDPKRVRVTGPFTVESLSPHRTISVEEKKRRAEVGHVPSGLKIKVHGPDEFGQMILDNLRTAGVQNTFKKERLKFDCLQPYAGQWIHGEGWYTEQPSSSGKSPHPNSLPEGEGTRKRVAVCIGPEHGTVGPQLVKEAAKEAVQGVGFDLLIVCGFAFDPHVSEEAKRYGKLVVLPTRMNPDLTMGELLKKTGSGNLFIVFGEPDLELKRQPDGRIVVKLNGLDIYDPTTGEIRSSSTDDIACWFLDTNYNDESFFVRHAYFTGADEPYEKLKRALRADIDEAAWSALYSTSSRAFDRPESGKIAVKVINHYGDEVLKVFELS